MAETKEIIKNRTVANKMLITEATLVGLGVLLLFVFVDLESAYSVLLGGLAFVLPNFIFVRLSLGNASKISSNRALTWFYIGEALKIVLTILIFAGAFIWVAPLNVGLMFVSYGLTLLVNLTGLAILMNR